MPPADAHVAFAQAAAEEGIELLEGQEFGWLCEQGHVGLERVAEESGDPALAARASAVAAILESLFVRLGGDLSVLHASRENLLLPVDLVHASTGTLIEIDEAQHFTSFRLAALDLYPRNAIVGFDVDEQKSLCRAFSEETDGFERGLAAKAFGLGGRQRERAYRDSLRDLATPAMGHPPLVRIAAADGDGGAAYTRHREALSGFGSASP